MAVKMRRAIEMPVKVFATAPPQQAKYSQFRQPPFPLPNSVLSPLAGAPTAPVPRLLRCTHAVWQPHLILPPMQQRQNKKLFAQMGKLQGILSEIP